MTRKKSKQDALIDELLQDGHNTKDILGKDRLLKQLTGRSDDFDTKKGALR